MILHWVQYGGDHRIYYAILLGPEYLPTSWSQLPNTAVVSYTSNIHRSDDIGNCSGLFSTLPFQVVSRSGIVMIVLCSTWTPRDDKGQGASWKAVFAYLSCGTQLHPDRILSPE